MSHSIHTSATFELRTVGRWVSFSFPSLLFPYSFPPILPFSFLPPLSHPPLPLPLTWGSHDVIHRKIYEILHCCRWVLEKKQNNKCTWNTKKLAPATKLWIGDLLRHLTRKYFYNPAAQRAYCWQKIHYWCWHKKWNQTRLLTYWTWSCLLEFVNSRRKTSNKVMISVIIIIIAVDLQAQKQKLTAFSSHDTWLHVWMPWQFCLFICLSHLCSVSKQLNGSSWLLEWRFTHGPGLLHIAL